MGISVQQWRARVGCFCQPGPKKHPKDISASRGHHYQKSYSMLPVLTLCCLFFIVDARTKTTESMTTFANVFNPGDNQLREMAFAVADKWNPRETMSWRDSLVSQVVTSGDIACTSHHTTMLVQRILICGDVECNPGPGPGKGVVKQTRQPTQPSQDSADDNLVLTTAVTAASTSAEDNLVTERRVAIQEMASGHQKYAVCPPAVNIKDNENNWLVVGLAMNKVLAPVLRMFVERVLIDLHGYLSGTSDLMKQQTYGNHLTHHPPRPNKGATKSQKTHRLSPNELKYENINNNGLITGQNRKQRWDYSINTPFDLARLFMQPFMAKCSSFAACDPSALLGLVKKVDDSASNDELWTVRTNAEKVQEIRNMYSHCHYADWNEPKFMEAFKRMKNLLIDLKATPDVIQDLDNWQKNGKTLCTEQVVQSDILQQFRMAQSILAQEFQHQGHKTEGEIQTMKEDMQALTQSLQALTQRMQDTEQQNPEEDNPAVLFEGMRAL